MWSLLQWWSWLIPLERLMFKVPMHKSDSLNFFLIPMIPVVKQGKEYEKDGECNLDNSGFFFYTTLQLISFSRRPRSDDDDDAPGSHRPRSHQATTRYRVDWKSERHQSILGRVQWSLVSSVSTYFWNCLFISNFEMKIIKSVLSIQWKCFYLLCRQNWIFQSRFDGLVKKCEETL